MQIQLDTKTKTITLLEQVTVKEFLLALVDLDINTKDWKIGPELLSLFMGTTSTSANVGYSHTTNK